MVHCDQCPRAYSDISSLCKHRAKVHSQPTKRRRHRSSCTDGWPTEGNAGQGTSPDTLVITPARPSESLSWSPTPTNSIADAPSTSSYDFNAYTYLPNSSPAEYLSTLPSAMGEINLVHTDHNFLGSQQRLTPCDPEAFLANREAHSGHHMTTSYNECVNYSNAVNNEPVMLLSAPNGLGTG